MPPASRSAHRRRSATAAAGAFCLLVAATLVTGPAFAAPVAAGASPCPWVGSTAPVSQRVAQVLAAMTLDDKIAMVHGNRTTTFAGGIPANPRLCLPSLTLTDGPAGVANKLPGATQLPDPTALAATFDRATARAYGGVIGAEQRAKGVDVALAPTVNIVRDPRWGRAFESLGEDPQLAGEIAVSDIDGIQANGVMAQLKHYAVYNQEQNRNTPADNAIVDERTQEEIYLPQFETAVRAARPASVMCAFSWVNGTNACQNSRLLTGDLKQRWGFPGFVTSDWNGTHSLAAAEAGLDLEMPAGGYFDGPLRQAVASGRVPVARLDDMVGRILGQMFSYGLIDHPRERRPQAVVTTAAHAALARSVAAEGTVLLRNERGLLPLQAERLKSIAVIGDSAGADAKTAGGGSAHVIPPYVVTPVEGITRRAGPGVAVRFAQGVPSFGAFAAVPSSVLRPSAGAGTGLTGRYYDNMTRSGPAVLTRNVAAVDFAWNGHSPGTGVNATNWSASFTGTVVPPMSGSYTFTLSSDDGSRLQVAGRTVVDNWRGGVEPDSGTVTLTAGVPAQVEVDYVQHDKTSRVRLGWETPGGSTLLGAAVRTARSSDVAVVFVSTSEGEGGDLPDISLSRLQNTLVTAVAAANPRTIVVLDTGSAVALPWRDQVPGLLEAWYPGQEDGNAIASVLFGDVDPSAKLPVSFPRNLADVPARTTAQWPGVNGRVLYSEGLGVGYRWYDRQGIAPAFPFGFGLSYTSFAFSHPAASAGSIRAGGSITVTADVRNTGSRAGSEVAQLYVAAPASTGEPPKQLAGFAKIRLAPGQTGRVSFPVPARAFSQWNATSHGWVLTPGRYDVLVGDSSRNLPLRVSITVA